MMSFSMDKFASFLKFTGNGLSQTLVGVKTQYGSGPQQEGHQAADQQWLAETSESGETPLSVSRLLETNQNSRVNLLKDPTPVSVRGPFRPSGNPPEPTVIRVVRRALVGRKRWAQAVSGAGFVGPSPCPCVGSFTGSSLWFSQWFPTRHGPLSLRLSPPGATAQPHTHAHTGKYLDLGSLPAWLTCLPRSPVLPRAPVMHPPI